MQIIQSLPSTSSSCIYAQFNHQLITAELANTVLALPLIYEFDNRQSFDRVNKWLTEISVKTANTLLYEDRPNYKGKIFPVYSASRQAMRYLPHLLKHNTFSFSSVPSTIAGEPDLHEIPHISYKTALGMNYDVSSLDPTSFEMYSPTATTHYEVPSVSRLSFDTYLQTQLFTRYSAPAVVEDSQHRSNASRIVLDSFLPFLLVGTSLSNELSTYMEYNSRRYSAISPFTAEFLNIERIPFFEILTSVLEKDLDQIKATLLRVKAKKLTVVFAGVGGTGTNTIYWLNELLTMMGIKELFNQVHIYEKDYVDFSNIFRFPIPLSTYTNIKTPALPKADLIKPFTRLLSSMTFFHNKYIETTKDLPSMLLTEDSKSLPNTIIYGAPSIANRNLLSSVGNFVSATHANNTASLYANPIADETLQVETYGLIQLNSFFINQISMMLGFIEMLDNDAYMAHDHHYTDYTFIAYEKAGLQFNIKEELTAFEIGDQD